MSALKRCPFCGGEATLTNVRMSNHSFKIGCYNDTCWRPGTDLFDSEKAATEAWNTRTNARDEPMNLAIETLRRVLTTENLGGQNRVAIRAALENLESSGLAEEREWAAFIVEQYVPYPFNDVRALRQGAAAVIRRGRDK